MARILGAVLLACVVAIGVAACGSSGSHKQPPTAPSATSVLRSCLRHHGYSIDVESPAVRATAPKNFEFLEVWNLLNPNRIALAMTISRTPAGAARAAAWTRRTNARISKGAVRAPVVQLGRINVLWTAEPGPADKTAIYGCVRSA